jgi:hypothetical protein
MIDYRPWRKLFVESNLTFSQLSQLKGAPSVCSLKLRSAKEGWMQQRHAYQLARSVQTEEKENVRQQADRAIVAIDREVQRVTKILKDLQQLQKSADIMFYRSVQRFSELNLEELSPRDVATFIKIGWEIKAQLVEIQAARINWENPEVKQMFEA